ncbi:MAG: acyl-CoA reductase [Chloroflexi bacterium]|nr:acyl-CoA reductase [Chloroflexota bacterium]
MARTEAWPGRAEPALGAPARAPVAGTCDPIDAWWLPGLDTATVRDWRLLEFPPDGDRATGAAVVLRVPVLAPAQLAAVVEHIAAARDAYLARVPVSQVVATIDRAINRWLDPWSPWRRLAERALPAITGYCAPMVRKGLPGYLATFRAENLWRLLTSELGDPAYLDAFRPRPAFGGYSRAYGPRLAMHVFAGNVPGLPAQSLVCALLAKAACLGKAASEEPLFAPLFAASLAAVDPRLGECLAVCWWPGGDEALEAVAFERADAVIAYGGEAAMASIRARVPPTKRFIAYSHKLSFGVIGREALSADTVAETAARAAYDVAKYDQQGCLSPHLFYVERGGTVAPRAFAAALAQALAEAERLMPRGRLRLDETAAIRDLRAAVEFRALDDPRVALHASPGSTAWTVVYEEDPAFAASCLNRTVRVKPVDDVATIPALLAPVQRYLQTAGVALPPPRLLVLAEQLGALGLDRVCPLGQMPDPSPGWHHDGRFNVLDLLRWTDLEAPASAGRWEFAHPEAGLYGHPCHPIAGSTAPHPAGVAACRQGEPEAATPRAASPAQGESAPARGAPPR